MLSSMRDILQEAYQKKYAIPQPDFVSIDMAAAYLHAASKYRFPVILGFGEEYLDVSGAANLKHLVKIIEELSNAYDIPVVLHLDHGRSYEACVRAINAGFTSVMFDGSSLPFEENIQITKGVVEIARLGGVSVEAELGRLKNAEDYDMAVSDSQVLTDPETAGIFVEETGVDALAVSIGSVHGDYSGELNIRIDLLKQINNLVGIPLVLHGATGIPYQTLSKCVQNGVAKVNIYTDFANTINQIVREHFIHAEKFQIPGILGDIRVGISEKLEEYTQALGSINKA
ncbi:class II fructose-bisphosphate aldolase [Lederbergia citri]|uniref:Class II fructose-bisphosphate aldolase n=1 Tax=Lederbergia citri TaxID=2833580 RepID=A0A942TFV6_9BACI|nr:class II fructose-bisphosphate aldolase [Lederbergia citri]MBS4195777.1 class II fructose-bisphosphate aldolase [Lederbergia citri]